MSVSKAAVLHPLPLSQRLTFLYHISNTPPSISPFTLRSFPTPKGKIIEEDINNKALLCQLILDVRELADHKGPLVPPAYIPIIPVHKGKDTAGNEERGVPFRK
jgi:hypothetical protein